MAENKTIKAPLPETFDTFEEMAEFWDTHDVTDYEDFLTPIEATVVASPQRRTIKLVGRRSAVGGHLKQDMSGDHE